MLDKRLEYLKNLYNDIYNTKIEERNQKFLGNVNDIKSDHTNDEFVSVNNVYNNTIYGNFIKALKDNQINALIGGSYALSCVWKKFQISPNDLDMCIININKDIIVLLEKIIRNVYKNYKILVMRNMYMLTFFICDNNDNYYASIQTHITNIESWPELFVNSISDVTCMGFDVINNNFVYMKNRWENIFTDNDIIFTNYLNFDNEKSIQNAIEKYIERGFKCTSIYINNHDLLENHYKIFSYSNCSDHHNTAINDNNILKILLKKYKNKSYRSFSNTVNTLFFKENIPSIRCLSIRMMNKQDIESAKNFIHFSNKIYFKYGYYILDGFDKIFSPVCVKCKTCGNVVSLNDFLNDTYCHELRDKRILIY